MGFNLQRLYFFCVKNELFFTNSFPGNNIRDGQFLSSSDEFEWKFGKA